MKKLKQLINNQFFNQKLFLMVMLNKKNIFKKLDNL